MSKVLTRGDQTQHTRRPRVTRRTGGHNVATSSPKQAVVNASRYPKMSPSALAFARQMQGNPHVRAVMRDLKNK